MTGLLLAVLEQLLFAAPLLVGVVMIGAKGRGPARRLGLAGCVIMLAGQILGGLWSWVLLPRLVGELGYSSLQTAIPGSVIGVFSSVGLLLVILAVTARSSSPHLTLAPPPRPPGPQPR